MSFYYGLFLKEGLILQLHKFSVEQENIKHGIETREV